MTETILEVITFIALVAMWVPILDALPFVMLLLFIITVMAIVWCYGGSEGAGCAHPQAPEVETGRDTIL